MMTVALPIRAVVGCPQVAIPVVPTTAAGSLLINTVGTALSAIVVVYGVGFLCAVHTPAPELPIVPAGCPAMLVQCY